MSNDVAVWITPGSDIEASFCQPGHLSALLDISSEEAQEIISEGLAALDQRAAERDFNTALHSAVATLADKRSIPSERWRELGSFCSKTVKGKMLLDSISQAIANRFRGTPDARKLAMLPKIRSPTHAFFIAECLKPVVERALLGK